MNKKNQMEIVYNIVRFNQPIRTERVKIMAMQAGVSCADRYLRWLKEDDFVAKKKLDKDNTVTWYATDKVYENKKGAAKVTSIIAEVSGQLCMDSVAVCFCLAVVLLFGTPAHADFSSGKAMTKKFEGYRSEIYICPAGASTIGYGFNIDSPAVKELLSLPVLSGRSTLKKQEAERVFDALYGKAKKSTIRFIGQHHFQRLSRIQKDILIDMAYNLGPRRLADFRKMRKAIQAGDYVLAAAEMKDSLWYRQTGRRAKHHVKEFQER